MNKSFYLIKNHFHLKLERHEREPMGILGSGNRHRRLVGREISVVDGLEFLSVHDKRLAAVDVEALAG